MLKKIAALTLLVGVLAACGTGVDRLEVTSLVPADGATGVSVDVVLEATFDRDIDEATLDGSFTLASDGGEVAGTVAYDAATRTASFTPNADLAAATTYTATVSGSVSAADGGSLSGDASWSFTTEAASVTSVVVTPSEASLQLGVNETVQLEATVSVVGGADSSVTWASDAEGVATVDADGLVTAMGDGTATITATSTADTSVSGEATITVGPAPAVSSVEVSPSETTLEIGGTETVQLEATVTAVGGADTSVTWASDAEGVATVNDSGLVTAEGDGVATITATSVFDGSVSGEATITVETLPAVNDVTVSPDSAILSPLGTTTAQLDATVTAVGGADESVTWASDDEGVATVDGSGLVTAVAEGTATITATSVFDGDVSGSASITVAPELVADPIYDGTLVAGETISILPSVSGGAEPYAFAVATEPETALEITGFPPGTTFDPATGEISGTTTLAGFFREAVVVSDASGQSVETLSEIRVLLDLSYAQATYTYADGETGEIVPADDVTLIGDGNRDIEFTMELVAPEGGDAGTFTIDSVTGAIDRAIDPTVETTWTYEVTATLVGDATIVGTTTVTFEEVVPE